LTDERVQRGMGIQLSGWRSALANADVERVGWKIGLNAPAVLEALELDRPVVGWIASGTTLDPPAEVPLAGTTRLGAEPELAITVGEGDTVAGLAPAIELVDIDRPFDDLVTILADNIFHRGVVFGAEVEPRPLEGITARIERDGAPEAELDLAETVGDPADVVALVAGRLAEAGEELAPGDRIIAGSLTPILWAEPGRSVALDLGPVGAVSLRYA
jgi:2-keto-4-pentenoate hydratase